MSICQGNPLSYVYIAGNINENIIEKMDETRKIVTTFDRKRFGIYRKMYSIAAMITHHLHLIAYSESFSLKRKTDRNIKLKNDENVNEKMTDMHLNHHNFL